MEFQIDGIFLGTWARRKRGNIPGGGTAVTALQTAQHTEVAPTG